MFETFRIHFGRSSRSRFYPQAVELAEQGVRHQVSGQGEDTWHTVTLCACDLDLVAQLYKLAVKLPGRRIYSADARYLQVFCASNGRYDYYHASVSLKKRVASAAARLQEETGKTLPQVAAYLAECVLGPVDADMRETREHLIRAGYLDYTDPHTGALVKAIHEPAECSVAVTRIQNLISSQDYAGAVGAYYDLLAEKPYGPLTKELLYLKRLARMPLMGRDLLFFLPDSGRSDVVRANLQEYVSCIDEALSSLTSLGRRRPLAILLENVPTMDNLVKLRADKWHNGAYLNDGAIERDFTPVTVDTFSSAWDWCPEGRLFRRYPDPVLFCRVVERESRPFCLGLWTKYSPEFYQAEVLDKGLHLNALDVYFHRAWGKSVPGERRVPGFAAATSWTDVARVDSMPTATVDSFDTDGIRYTGRTHIIDGQTFYEIDVLNRQSRTEAEVLANPLLEVIDEVLREAENLLREDHGLPRIGQGWISEMQVYRLVQGLFPDAVHQASPPWLGPQHLDVYVPSRAFAIEYHGLQHFAPVGYFGGDEALHDTQRRDKRKKRLCEEHGVALVIWRFDEAIDESTLHSKLAQFL